MSFSGCNSVTSNTAACPHSLPREPAFSARSPSSSSSSRCHRHPPLLRGWELFRLGGWEWAVSGTAPVEQCVGEGWAVLTHLPRGCCTGRRVDTQRKAKPLPLARAFANPEPALQTQLVEIKHCRVIPLAFRTLSLLGGCRWVLPLCPVSTRAGKVSFPVSHGCAEGARLLAGL